MLGQQQYERAVAAGGGDAKKGYKTLASGGSQARSSGGGFNLGGLLGSLGSAYAARKAAQIARENREWQEKQNTIAYERSLPWSNYGPAGSVEFDPETKEILQTLDPQYQAAMQGFLGSSAMATEELQGLMSDPNKMAKDQFDLLQEFSADAYNQSRLQGEEAAIAQGRIGTQGYYDKMVIEDSINKNILQDKISSVGLGMENRKMVGQEALQNLEAAMSIPGLLTNMTTSGIQSGQGSNVGANMLGIMQGGQDYADTQSSFWSGMLDQGAKYNPNTGVKTADAKPGLFSNLFNLGRKGYSMMTDKSYIA
jgi:hypothetical protein